MECEYAGFRLATAVPDVGSVGAAGTRQGNGGTIVGAIDRVDPTTLTPRQIFDRWVCSGFGLSLITSLRPYGEYRLPQPSYRTARPYTLRALGRMSPSALG